MSPSEREPARPPAETGNASPGRGPAENKSPGNFALSTSQAGAGRAGGSGLHRPFQNTPHLPHWPPGCGLGSRSPARTELGASNRPSRTPRQRQDRNPDRAARTWAPSQPDPLRPDAGMLP